MLNIDIDFLDSGFIGVKKPIREASFDKDNGIFMTQSQRDVICFDDVAIEYSKRVIGSAILSSVDALFFQNQEIFLVEFKNGCLTSSKIEKNKRKLIRLEIQKKFYETMLVLMDLKNDFSFDYFKKNATFILVYNEEKNFAKEKIQNAKQKQSVQKLNLSYMQSYCCKNFYTYTAKEFDDFLIQKNLY